MRVIRFPLNTRLCPPLTQRPSVTRLLRGSLYARSLSTTGSIRQDGEKKSSLMDRDSMNTESNEYSKTGSDSKAAQEDTAYDADKTSPESQVGSSSDQAPDSNSQGNPLSGSPGNQDLNSARGKEEPEKGPDRTSQSGRGGATKGRQAS